MRLTSLTFPTVGGETDAETLAWFRSIGKQERAIICGRRDAAWAAFDPSAISEDALFYLWRISLGEQKVTARSLMDARRAKAEAFAVASQSAMDELDAFLAEAR
jgi:hypothetical protein